MGTYVSCSGRTSTYVEAGSMGRMLKEFMLLFIICITKRPMKWLDIMKTYLEINRATH